MNFVSDRIEHLKEWLGIHYLFIDILVSFISILIYPMDWVTIDRSW